MIGEFVRRLIAAGCDPAVAAAVAVELYAAGMRGPERNPRQERNARYYAKCKASETVLKASESKTQLPSETVLNSDAPELAQGLQFPFLLTESGNPESKKERKKEESREKISKTPDDWPPDYEKQFWERYPHKVAKAYALKCLGKIRKRGAVTWEALMAGLLRYAAKTDDRPWCNPATWLNGQRWLDDPATNLQTENGRGRRQQPSFQEMAENFRKRAKEIKANESAQTEATSDTIEGEILEPSFAYGSGR